MELAWVTPKQKIAGLTILCFMFFVSGYWSLNIKMDLKYYLNRIIEQLSCDRQLTFRLTCITHMKSYRRIILTTLIDENCSLTIESSSSLDSKLK